MQRHLTCMNNYLDNTNYSDSAKEQYKSNKIAFFRKLKLAHSYIPYEIEKLFNPIVNYPELTKSSSIQF